MSISRTRAQDYAETVINRPGGELTLTLKRGKRGITLLYRGRAVTKCHASRVGAMQAACMAQALGVELPPRKDLVPTGAPALLGGRRIGHGLAGKRRDEGNDPRPREYSKRRTSHQPVSLRRRAIDPINRLV